MKVQIWSKSYQHFFLISIVILFCLICMTSNASAATNDVFSTNPIVQKAQLEKLISTTNPAAMSSPREDAIQNGTYFYGTAAYLYSHYSNGTYTYRVGTPIYVSGEFYDDYGLGGFQSEFFIYDKLTDKIVKLYLGKYMDSYTYSMMDAKYIDTSGLTVSTGRYQVGVALYDTDYGRIEDIDLFNLNVASISAPTISSAVSSGVHSAQLSWSPVSGVSGYGVYRATSSTGTYTYIGSTTSTTYSSTGLTTGRTYYYKVRAYCSGGAVTKYGSFSSYRSVKPIPPTPAPTATSASYTSARLTWPAVSGANGYQIYRSTTSTGTYTYLATVTSTSYTNSALATGKTYYYKVRAYHTESTGTKYYSNYCTYRAVRPIPAAAVVQTSLQDSNQSIKVSWNAVSGASGYQVYRSSSATDTYALVATVGPTTTSWTSTGLSAGEQYYYKVRAYHIEGSAYVYGVFSSYSCHGTVGIPSINATPQPGGTSLLISWEGMDVASGYEIYQLNFDGSKSYLGNAPAGATSYLDTGLALGEEYTYVVQAFHNENAYTIYGGYSAPKSAVTADVPATLTTPVLTMVGTVYDTNYTPGVKISWTPVDGASGYVIEFLDVDYDTEFYALNYVTAPTTTYYDWEYIDPEYGYYAYRIWAYYGDLNSPDTLVYSDYSNIVYYYGSYI